MINQLFQSSKLYDFPDSFTPTAIWNKNFLLIQDSVNELIEKKQKKAIVLLYCI